MKTSTIFQNGNSQAVRLPKDFRFKEKDVYLTKIGKMVVITPKKAKWEQFLESLDEFSDDFMNDRNQPAPQARKLL